MTIQGQSEGSESEVVKRLKEKIEHLRIAEATVSNALARFEIKKELEEAESMLSALLQTGIVGSELGLEGIDGGLLDSYFSECAKFDSIFEAHLRGSIEPRRQFLISRGFAFVSPKGATALTDEGVLFCALRELISSTRFHVHVQLQLGGGKTAIQDSIWGSVLYLHRELSKRLDPLSSRVVGNPERRNNFGGETAIAEYPRVAIIEALTNFLIHRDYQEDDHGRVNIFDDRIEFINPGMSTVPIEVLLKAAVDLEPKYSRNPRLIEAMSLSRLNQRKGSGIRRIREVLAENGSLLPDGSIGLKLWNDTEKRRFHLTIYRRDLRKLVSSDERVSSAGASALRVDVSRVVKYAPAELIGREWETGFLNDAWGKAERGETQRPHVLTFVALGGEGKTSLVAKWVADLAHQGWPGCEAAFAWSFYSQGTREQTAASTDVFLMEALIFFGDPELADGAQGAFEKGRRLAQLVGERRALLVLDGLEPLQYGPTSSRPGELKDQGMSALLKGLASSNHGLCVVTTRYSIPDLRGYWRTTAPETKLARLSKEAGVAMLQKMGVRKESGSQNEFEILVEDVRGHALSLNLVGSYLRDAHAGDIRKRDLVNLGEADAEEQGGYAFRLMDAYARSFESEGEPGKRALAVLRLLGLFDRPATADGLIALLKAPPIPDLTGALAGLSETERNVAFARLENGGLLTVNRDASGMLISLDAHPLLREYFAQQVRTQLPDAWGAGHRRLYEHLCATTPDKPRPTLEDLQPLYQAVAHGCQAGMQQEAFDDVYFARIKRRDENYSSRKLGAFGSDLGAVARFFEVPWGLVSPALTETARAWLLNEAALNLRALGRLTEAVEPMRAALEMGVEQDNWKDAAVRAGNLSGLEVTLGELVRAVADAEQAVTYADRIDDLLMGMVIRTTHADVLHQAGRRSEAESRFREAEVMQAESQPDYPLLYSVRGFQYCDLLLAPSERAAWQLTLRRSVVPPPSFLVEVCRAVSRRAVQTLQWVTPLYWLLDIALDQLTVFRAALYEAILEEASPDAFRSSIQHAVDGLRRAGQQDHLPSGLLTRAWLRSLSGEQIGPESAQNDLDEAWEIAERGPMPLFMADIHLHRARLFGRPNDEGRGADYPWESPQVDLGEARRLIEKHGYWRRKEELEDAEKAAQSW
jgi:Putative ATP-dependent DNA helicase recG C-terminal